MSEKKHSRSVSQLKQVTRCGEAFAISRGFRGPRPPKRPWAQTVGGIAFHEMLVRWEASGRTVDALEIFKEEWEKALAEAKSDQPDINFWMVPPGTKYPKAALKGVYKRFTEKDVPLYIRRCEEADWEIYKLPDGSPALEIPFTVDLKGVIVHAKIDRIQWWPKQKMVSIEDTKTGSPDEENDVRQLALYRLGALKQYNIDLQYGRYWFTKVDRGSPWVDLSRWTEEKLADAYFKLDKIISEDLLLPSPGKQCNVCDVRPWCSEMGWLEPGEEYRDV